MRYKRIALGFIFIWFFIGGIAHFAATAYFLKIVPPSLPFRSAAVYISGFFELAGAFAILHPQLRRSAGIGLCLLTLAVTPANIYMWQNPQLFPGIPVQLLSLRLVIQAMLLACIWWATKPDNAYQ
ncbi:MAG: hypothetical protein V4443_10005 [Pseudomonadota bacterium]